MLAKVQSCAIIGLESVPIEVEVDIVGMGLPSFTIVGLPDKAVEEAKERVRAAIKNSGADFPPKRITINLAPSDIPKEGTHYDLPIAIGILIASGQLSADVSKTLLLGELSLDGSLRSVNGVLPMVYLAKEHNIDTIFVPSANAPEASVVTALLQHNEQKPIAVYAAASLSEIFDHLCGNTLLSPISKTPQTNGHFNTDFAFDMTEIKGQEQAKRAIEICAAGGHNISLKGAPGAGKTMLARALISILPTMTENEMLEVTKIYSVCGLLKPDTGLVASRPFRSPHHTISPIGLVGGGSKPRPGEISLAHRGILFLDEFPQFNRSCIESLRAPIEDGTTTIVRATQALTFPSKFMLVTAQNPCPCGYLGDEAKHCICTSSQVIRYQKRVSGPILDRIDLHIDVPKVSLEKLTGTAEAENSKAVQKRVQKARNMQTKRFTKQPITCNAEMRTQDIKLHCAINDETRILLRAAIEKMHLTARSYYRTLKVARTIADLASETSISKEHVAEALQYRQRDYA